LTAHPREGAAELDRVIELARSSQQLLPLCMSNAFQVLRCEIMGEAARALAHGRESVDYAERIGSNTARLFGYFTLGRAHVANRGWRDALDALAQARAIGNERRLQLWEGGVLAAMAAAHLGLGDRTTALALADEAIAVSRRRGSQLWELWAFLTRVRALHEIKPRLLRDGQARDVAATGDIEATLAEVEAWIRTSGATSYAPFMYLARAELAAAVGDAAGRERALREAHRLFTAMGAPIRAEQAARELSR
jgi:tetratricopeptide (TPR) repeat protein